MIPERELLQAWKDSKTGSHFYRLKSEIAAAFEYRGQQFGHPSNYASIKLVATPSSELCIESVAIYPGSVSEPYARRLLVAVGRAAVDEFFAPTWDPYRGCKLVVHDVGWDEIMSSEVALYRAARGALATLRQQGNWELVT